jgi:hypothetical protein
MFVAQPSRADSRPYMPRIESIIGVSARATPKETCPAERMLRPTRVAPITAPLM